MLLVVDANILFSAAIKHGKTAEIIFSEEISLITPEFIISEFKKYKEEILSKTHRSKNEIIKFFLTMENKIEVIPSANLKTLLLKANSISPDPDDAHYFAAALKYKCPIWSNDKKLKEQSDIEVFSTQDIVKILEI